MKKILKLLAALSLKKTDSQIDQLTKSEFGLGLCYNLGLFLAHAERWKHTKDADSDDNVELWFNGAADHFYDFQVSYAPKNLQKRCLELRDKCLSWRLSWEKETKATKEDRTWAIQEAKDLLRLIDASHGIPTIQGGWE